MISKEYLPRHEIFFSSTPFFTFEFAPHPNRLHLQFHNLIPLRSHAENWCIFSQWLTFTLKNWPCLFEPLETPPPLCRYAKKNPVNSQGTMPPICAVILHSGIIRRGFSSKPTQALYFCMATQKKGGQGVLGGGSFRRICNSHYAHLLHWFWNFDFIFMTRKWGKQVHQRQNVW